MIYCNKLIIYNAFFFQVEIRLSVNASYNVNKRYWKHGKFLANMLNFHHINTQSVSKNAIYLRKYSKHFTER